MTMAAVRRVLATIVLLQMVEHAFKPDALGIKLQRPMEHVDVHQAHGHAPLPHSLKRLRLVNSVQPILYANLAIVLSHSKFKLTEAAETALLTLRTIQHHAAGNAHGDKSSSTSSVKPVPRICTLMPISKAVSVIAVAQGKYSEDRDSASIAVTLRRQMLMEETASPLDVQRSRSYSRTAPVETARHMKRRRVRGWLKCALPKDVSTDGF